MSAEWMDNDRSKHTRSGSGGDPEVAGRFGLRVLIVTVVGVEMWVSAMGPLH